MSKNILNNRRNLTSFHDSNARPTEYKIMKRRIRIIMIALTMTFVSLFLGDISARANTTDANDSKETVIRVGCVDIDNFLEFQGDTVVGYGADFLQEISVYTGWKYEYIKGSWSECLKLLKNGEIDLLLPAEYSDGRAEDYLYSERECCTDYVVMLCSSENDNLFYEDYESFNGLKVGMSKGNYLNDCFEEYAAQNNFSCNEKLYDTGEKMQAALDDGEVDVIITGNLDINSDVKILAKFSYMPAYFIMNKKSTEWMEQLNLALYTINLENPYFIAQLYQTYYGSYGAQAKELTRQESEYIKNLGTIRVVCDSDNYPFEYYDDKSKSYKGVDVDILEKLSENSGLDFEYIYVISFDEAWKMIGNGEADIIAGVYLNQALCGQYNVSPTSSYITENSDAIYLESRKLSLDDIKTVAVRKSLVGTTEYLHTHYPNWMVVTYDSMKDCLSAVSSGEADLTFVGSYTMQNDDVLEDYPKLAVLTGLSINVPECLGVSNQTSKVLQSVLNKSLKTISDNQIQQFVINNSEKGNSSFSIKASVREYPLEWISVMAVFFAVLAFSCFMIFKAHMQKNYTISLQKKNEELAKANQVTNTFFTQLSHDMRTPMNAILGFSELGLDCKDDTESNGYFEKIQDSGHYLMKLINDSLQIGKITTGKLEIKSETISLLKLKEELMSILAIKASQKEIDFDIDVSAFGEKAIITDKMCLKEILVNLLNNAVKFTPSKGQVSLKAFPSQKDDKGVTFIVKDTGIGMSKEFMEEHLYESFAQEQYVSVSSEEGTGLGLSIVKRLVEALNGKVSCESQRGKGTTFTVTLPIDVILEVPLEEEKTMLDDSCLKGKRILVCEDNELNTEIITMLLDKKGIYYDTAADGRIAVEKFEAADAIIYDAILMDIRMPNMDGLEATKAIRASSHACSSTVPIIAMTANAYPQDIEKTKEAGMNAHLTKPIEPGVLYEELVKWLG